MRIEKGLLRRTLTPEVVKQITGREIYHLSNLTHRRMQHAANQLTCGACRGAIPKGDPYLHVNIRYTYKEPNDLVYAGHTSIVTHLDLEACVFKMAVDTDGPR